MASAPDNESLPLLNSSRNKSLRLLLIPVIGSSTANMILLDFKSGKFWRYL